MAVPDEYVAPALHSNRVGASCECAFRRAIYLRLCSFKVTVLVQSTCVFFATATYL